jgi:hypothetical protein
MACLIVSISSFLRRKEIIIRICKIIKKNSKILQAGNFIIESSLINGELVLESEESGLKVFELSGPFRDVAVGNIDFVSELNNFTLESDDFFISNLEIVVDLVDLVIIFFNTLIFSISLFFNTILFVVKEIFNNLKDTSDESLVRLSTNFLGHLHKNAVESLSLVSLDGSKRVLVVSRDLSEDLGVLLEERRDLELFDQLRSLSESIDHAVVVVNALVESCNGFTIDFISISEILS